MYDKEEKSDGKNTNFSQLRSTLKHKISNEIKNSKIRIELRERKYQGEENRPKKLRGPRSMENC